MTKFMFYFHFHLSFRTSLCLSSNFWQTDAKHFLVVKNKEKKGNELLGCCLEIEENLDLWAISNSLIDVVSVLLSMWQRTKIAAICNSVSKIFRNRVKNLLGAFSFQQAIQIS